jgi:putative transposase
MTKGKSKAELIDVKELLARDEDFVRAAVSVLAQAALEAEMTERIGAAKGERSEMRLGYRSGYYSRSLITRVGTLELRVPQDRDGRFSTELFQRYQRSEKALVGTLAEMYVQGVSTRKSLPLRKQGSRQSPKPCAATASRPRRSAASTSRSTRRCRPLPSGG